MTLKFCLWFNFILTGEIWTRACVKHLKKAKSIDCLTKNFNHSNIISCYDLFFIGLDRYQFISSGDEVKPDGHSATCFCKEHLTDWFYERITYDKNGYNKLLRESVDDTKEVKMLQLQDGLYLLNGVPVNVLFLIDILLVCSHVKFRNLFN